MRISYDQESMAMEVRRRADRIIVFLFGFMFLLLPLITRAKFFPFISPVISGESVLNSGLKADVFNYYKFLFLLLMTVLILMVFLYKMIKGKYEIKPGYINLPLLVLFLLILLSGVFAPYTMVALVGAFDRFEGTFAYLSYLILFFVAANVEYTRRKLDWLVWALYPAVAINGIISLMYFYGRDLYQTGWVKALILPPGAEKDASGFLVTTLANPNYLSGFAGFAGALFFARALTEVSHRRKWVDAAFAVLAFAEALASVSTSGFLTFAAVVPLTLIAVAWVRLRRWWLPAAAGLVCFALVFGVLNHHNPSVWKETVGTFLDLGGLKESAWAPVATARAASPEGSGAAPEGGTEVPDGVNLPPAGWGPGTGRLYIWEKAAELALHRPLLGYGLDTFVFVFPQDDPAKNANLSDYRIIVDKPHSLYLGLAVGAGLPAFAAFAVLLALHAYHNLRLLWRKELPADAYRLLIPLLAAWAAYLVQGLVNDSVVGMAPLFWVLFGAGVSMVRRYSPGR
ncbi:MAG: O-antigen ligase family protein [Alicyclobacillaceae bacterium]|nr:O-antigen ligase family protein [Alicyclobacillaceae bacterium]